MNTSINLTVMNPGCLLHGCVAARAFDRKGGTLGSGDCDWQLTDRARAIKPLHCEVRWHEGSFCLIARDGKTYLNESVASLPHGRWVRLAADCSFKLAEYLITAQLGDSTAAGNSFEGQSLRKLLNEPCALQALHYPLESATQQPKKLIESFDPIAVLDASAAHGPASCPIEALIDSSLQEQEVEPANREVL